MGLDGLTGEADKAATTQATLALLTEQTADAQGAFAREAGTAAGAQQRANAQIKNATAAIGTALLPAVSAVAGVLGDMAGFVQDNIGAFQVLGGVLAGVAATILAIKGATMAWQRRTKRSCWQGRRPWNGGAMVAERGDDGEPDRPRRRRHRRPDRRSSSSSSRTGTR